jgi:dolichyl-phosphate-mannose--protein O-mannosyl transferase
MGVAPKHYFYSKWYQWPVLDMIWCKLWEKGERAVWGFGQPFVWTSGFVCVIVASGACVKWFRKGSFDRRKTTVLLMVVGFWASYLPFALVPRTTFFYHYIIPSIFAAMATAAFLDQFERRFWVGFGGAVLGMLAVFGLVFWGPLAYGLPVRDFRERVWMKRWIPG